MQRESSTDGGAIFQRSRTRPFSFERASALIETLSVAPALGLGILFAALIPSAHATAVYRFDNRHEAPGIFRLLPEVYSMTTTENYDPTGAKAAVPGLTSYKKTGIDLWGVYGVSRDLSLYARLSMASISYEASTVGALPALTASGSGLTEQALGANYRLWESRANAGQSRSTTIDGQFQIDIPLYDNVSLRNATPPQPLRGEGSLDLTAGAFMTHPFNSGAGQRLYGIAGLGLALRSNNYSKAIPYQLQIVGLPERSGLLWRAGIHGLKSLSGDDATTGPATSPGANRNDAGGSLIVDALNPSYMSLRLTGGYQWGAGNQVYLAYQMPMSGSSTAALKAIFLGAQFRIGTQAASSSSGARGSPSSGAKRKYVYDLDGHVKQANDRLNLIKIDKGLNDGIQKGDYVDVYRPKSDGTPGDLVARGVVTSVAPSESVVNLRQYKKQVWVQRGFVARRITIRK